MWPSLLLSFVLVKANFSIRLGVKCFALSLNLSDKNNLEWDPHNTTQAMLTILLWFSSPYSMHVPALLSLLLSLPIAPWRSKFPSSHQNSLIFFFYSLFPPTLFHSFFTLYPFTTFLTLLLRIYFLWIQGLAVLWICFLSAPFLGPRLAVAHHKSRRRVYQEHYNKRHPATERMHPSATGRQRWIYFIARCLK